MSEQAPQIGHEQLDQAMIDLGFKMLQSRVRAVVREFELSIHEHNQKIRFLSRHYKELDRASDMDVHLRHDSCKCGSF
ncbi:hypothetical protein H6801_02890 [Candidatus Nomurabacteria bacterium]|nr:hypothetical protein [Candidatus Nomurabacteria bacterium]